MSEHPLECRRFEEVSMESSADHESAAWSEHLEECASCRLQWSTHRILVATFSQESVPELSPSFHSGLERKIEAALAVQPLRGWRLVAMIGYALAAAAFMGWIFFKFPLPSLHLDPESPWTVGVAILAVPFTLWLTIGVTRWLPVKRGPDLGRLGML